MVRFPGRMGIQQRVLPTYRAPFFDRLAEECGGGLEVFAGRPRSDEGIEVAATLRVARFFQGRNVHFGRGRLYFCWQRDLLDWLRRLRPDVLIVSANPRLLSTHLAIRLVRSWRRPVIGWGLGAPAFSSPSDGKHAMRRWATGRFLRSFDVLIAYSSRGASEYVRAGASPERVLVAPNAVSGTHAEALSATLNGQPDLVHGYRQGLGLSDKPTILFVGRLIPPKRVDDLLRACSSLQHECELLIVGDGPERAALESLAASVFPTARFLGHLEGRDLALAYAAADLFVLPGTGGLAVHEAMLFGKPVLVGDADGTQADLVRDGRNGIILPPGGVGALERIIRSCLSDPDALRRMGQESRRIAIEEVSIDAMVRTFVHAVRLVTAGRPVSRCKVRS